MSNYRRADTKGATYFFTVVTYRRQKILCNEDIRTALHDGIQATRINHPFVIDAWALLPDHLHCIWSLPEHDANFSVRWAMIKRYVSKQCSPALQQKNLMNQSKNRRNESTLWQRRFWEHQIRDNHDYQKHMDYIHYNPVKHGYVSRTIDWPHSTFHRYVRQGVYAEDWGGEALAIDGKFGE